MKICICDDDRHFAVKLKTALIAYSFRTNYEFYFTIVDNTEDLMKCDADYHILFMDIRFGNKDTGIAVAKEVKKRMPGIYILFVTSMPRYALDGYSAHPYAYLVKPIISADLNATMDDLFATIEGRPGKQGIITIYSSKSKLLIIQDLILWVESDSIYKKRTVVTKEKRYPTREKLKDIFEKLPKERFAYCHQSYVVNLAYVSEVGKATIHMASGDELPLGRTNKTPFAFALNEFLKNQK